MSATNVHSGRTCGWGSHGKKVPHRSRGEKKARMIISPSSTPGGSGHKTSAFNAGDLGLIPESGRSSREGYGNPLQFSCLENPMDREAWWATQPMAQQSQTRLSD